MMNINDNIKDDEFRVIGKTDNQSSRPVKSAGAKALSKRKRIVLGAVAVFGLIVFLILLFLMIPSGGGPDDTMGYYESLSESGSQDDDIERVTLVKFPVEYIGDYSIKDKAYTEHQEISVNDIMLDIYIPHNAKPKLFIGRPRENDSNVIFTTQAADIRADNGKITGAFVLAGDPKAWGLSKKGYCAIINDKFTVGVAPDSPLFEKATDCKGYFFRQYPLVDNGLLVENVPKGKALRKAICDRGGEILVVMTRSKESFHDFSQALVDFGVDNAIYLVGGSSYGYFRDLDNQLHIMHPEFVPKVQKYENHLQWVLE